MEIENAGDVIESSAPADVPQIVVDTPADANDWESLVETATAKPDPVVDNQTDEVPAPAETQDEAKDEQPADEPEPESEAETPEGEAKDEPDDEADLSKRDKRTLNHNELKAERARLDKENQALQAQVQEKETALADIDAKLEQFGGVEGFDNAVKTLQNLANPAKVDEAAAYISSLPHGPQLESVFACRALGITGAELSETEMATVVNNQATALNEMLKRYQGLKQPLTADQVEKLGKFIALKANEDIGDFFADIDYALESTETPETRQLREMQAKIEALEAEKNGTAAPKPKTEQERLQEIFDHQVAVAKKFDDYEKNTFTTVADAILAEHGYNALPTDPPEVQKAKGVLKDIVFAHQSIRNRESNAFQVVASYLEKNAETSEGFKLYDGEYKRAMKLSIKEALRELTPLFKAGTASPKPPPAKAAAGASIDVPAAARNGGKAESFDDLLNSSRPR